MPLCYATMIKIIKIRTFAMAINQAENDVICNDQYVYHYTFVSNVPLRIYSNNITDRNYYL